MAEAVKKKVPTWLVIVGVLVALVIIGQASRLFSSALGNAEDSSAAADSPATTEEAEPEVEVPDYTVALIEDLSYGAVVRFQYRVVVPGEVDEAGLRAVVDEVVATAEQGTAFNALSVGLFASEDEIDGAYTLGVAELAPGGQWDAADTVEAGDYEAMELTVTIY